MSESEDSDVGSDISYKGLSDASESEDDNNLAADIEQLIRPWFAVDAERYEAPFQIVPFTRQTGILQRLNVTATPIEYVDKLSTDTENEQNIFSILAEQTNLYAEQSIDNGELQQHSRAHAWRETDEAEMRAFVGLILNMGIIKKPTIESYWQEGNPTWLSNTPSFGIVMRRNRFQNLLRYLHCNDNTEDVPRGQPGHDPAFKIRPILDLVNDTVSRHYALGRDITVDESIIGFKGRHHLVQYMPAKKAHRWGPKFFLLAESDTGYIHQMKLYTGKSRTPQPAGSPGVGYEIVKELVQPHLQRNHHVVIDNFFCSPVLCHYLYDNGTYVTGTARCFRKGIPRSFKGLKLPKGEKAVRQQGPLMAMSFSDRRQVTFLTTFATPVMQLETNNRGINRDVPNVVHVYNKKMGGVDLSDQQISFYDPEIRSVKMWKKILVNILLRVIGNAYIMYTQTRRFHKKMTRYEFHVNVIKSLVGDFREERKNTGKKRLLPMSRQLPEFATQLCYN